MDIVIVALIICGLLSGCLWFTQIRRHLKGPIQLALTFFLGLMFGGFLKGSNKLEIVIFSTLVVVCFLIVYLNLIGRVVRLLRRLVRA